MGFSSTGLTAVPHVRALQRARESEHACKLSTLPGLKGQYLLLTYPAAQQRIVAIAGPSLIASQSIGASFPRLQNIRGVAT